MHKGGEKEELRGIKKYQPGKFFENLSIKDKHHLQHHEPNTQHFGK
jgi:hypothetical protein